jgi:hypothetical protein
MVGVRGDKLEIKPSWFSLVEVARLQLGDPAARSRSIRPAVMDKMMIG